MFCTDSVCVNDDVVSVSFGKTYYLQKLMYYAQRLKNQINEYYIFAIFLHTVECKANNNNCFR